MSLKDLRIIADDRERKSGIPNLLKKAGINLEIKTLQIGDYIVSNETVVERKSIHDLISSVFDGRLFDQCSRLKENFERPILVVEGNTDELAHIVENPLVFYGALIRVAFDFHISVIPTPDADQTARLLVAMAARKNRLSGPYLKKIRKRKDLEQQQLVILSSLPGIGEKLAVRILERFGTPSAALSAPLPDLSKVPGLGKSRAERIKKILNTQYTESKSTQESLVLDDETITQ